MARVKSGCVPVAAYLWQEGEAIIHDVPAAEYWPPAGTKTPDGERYVVRGEGHAHLGNPTHERLEGGEVRPVPYRRATILFKRTRIARPRPIV